MIGAQIIPAGGLGQFIDDIREWQQRIVVIVDPSPGDCGAIRAVSPGTFIVGRVWRPDGEIAGAIMANPKAAARWARECIAPVAAGNREADVWQFANEVCQTSTAGIQNLNEFSIAYVDELGAIGLKAAIGGFGVGNPKTPAEDPTQWAAFYPAMRYAKARGGVLLLHAYGAMDIFGPDRAFYLYRYELKVLPFLPDDLKDMPYCYGEYGCDLGTLTQGDRRGWKTGYMNNGEQYVAHLYEAAQFLSQYSQCLGAAVFTLGTFGDWSDFDIAGDVARRLRRVEWPVVAETPVPPIEAVRLVLPYVSQIRPVVETDYAPGDCLQATLAGLVRALVRYVTVDELAEMTGLPPGYLSSNIITHGANLAARLGIRLAWQGRIEPDDLKAEIRARRAVILRVWYPYLEKKYDARYAAYHFITVHGYRGDVFFYDDPYWEGASGGEDIAISAAALRRAMWRATGGSTPAQGLLLRSHTLPLRGEMPPERPSREKLLYEAAFSEDRQRREGRPATADYIRRKWFDTALNDPEAA